MKTSTEIPQKIKNKTIIWFNNPTCGYLHKENKITDSKTKNCTHVYCSIIYNSQDTEATLVSTTDGRMNKDNVKYTHARAHTEEYYSAIKKEGNLAMYDSMDGS